MKAPRYKSHNTENLKAHLKMKLHTGKYCQLCQVSVSDRVDFKNPARIWAQIPSRSKGCHLGTRWGVLNKPNPIQSGGWRQGGRSPDHWSKETAQPAVFVKVKRIKHNCPVKHILYKLTTMRGIGVNRPNHQESRRTMLILSLTPLCAGVRHTHPPPKLQGQGHLLPKTLRATLPHIGALTWAGCRCLRQHKLTKKSSPH